LQGIPVAQAMVSEFRTLAPHDRLGEAARHIIAGFQHDFPVADNGRVIGVLTKTDLLKHMAEIGPDATVGDAIAEADHFVDVAQLNGRNLLPALDLKTHGDLTAEELQEWVKAWLARVEERLGVKPMIYAPTSLWVDWMGNTTWFADNGYRFWVRDWDSVDAPILPANNWGGHGWTLWQTGTAQVPGIKGWVDQNLFNGPVLAPIRIKNNR